VIDEGGLFVFTMTYRLYTQGKEGEIRIPMGFPGFDLRAGVSACLHAHWITLAQKAK
jgi:hypothetical protein